MFVFAAILFTFLVNSIRCDLTPIDPDYPTYTEHDFNTSRMFSTSSPNVMEEQCKPIRAWILARHGEKYPSEDILNDIADKLIPIIQQKINEVYKVNSQNIKQLNYSQKKCIDNIKNWRNVLARGSHKDLSANGKQSMLNLGKRLRDKLQKLVDRITPDEIEAVSAEEDRCLVSGKKILKSLFVGDNDEIDINRHLKKEDRRLKLVKPQYDKIKVENPHEPGSKIFLEDLFFKENAWKVTKNVRKRLFPDVVENYEELRNIVTDDLVKIMYDACVHGGTWCCVFRFEDFRFFEQMSDLGYYVKNGYFLDSNKKMGNPIMRDLLQFLKDPKDKKLKLFIGHTSNCMSIITRFDMFDDPEKLTKENITTKTKRKWKSSFMTPFGCNIMFVVYDCGYKTLKVTFFLNEQPIKMKKDDKYVCEKCSIDEFIKLIESFNLDEELVEENTIQAGEDKKKLKNDKMAKKMKNKEEKKENIRVEHEKKRLEHAMDDEIITFDQEIEAKAESSSTCNSL